MNKIYSKKYIFIISGLALIVTSISYLTFSSYKPKALQEIREVRGYQTQSAGIFDLPMPRYAKSIGYDQTLNSRSFTFQTDKSPEEIQKFYNNILLEDGWRLKKEGSAENFFTAEYRKDDLSVTIWASYDQDTKLTFASVEIIQFDK